MKRLLLFVTVLCGLMTVSTQDFFRLSKSAHAKGKPGPKWDVDFVSDGGFGSEVAGGAFEASDETYRTIFGTGSVVVTLSDGTILDDKPFLLRATDATGQPKLLFRIGVKDGHSNKDRYSAILPFPETTEDPSDGTPWLEEVVPDSVDDNLDMKPGAHVILHLHVENIALVGINKPNDGETLGYISVGDIEFTFPE